MTTELMTSQQWEQATLFAENLPDHAGQMKSYQASGLTVQQARTLEERAAKIITLGRRAILDIGAELLAARREAEHGTWGTFLRRCGLEDRTAANYMRVAERFQNRPEVITALPSTVLYLPNLPDEVVEEVLQGKVEPTLKAVKAAIEQKAPPRAAPPTPRNTPQPVNDDDEDEGEVVAVPASRPAATAVLLTPLEPQRPTGKGADVETIKQLQSAQKLLQAMLGLVEEELEGALAPDSPAVTVPEHAALMAARTFMASPAYKMAVVGLTMWAKEG